MTPFVMNSATLLLVRVTRSDDEPIQEYQTQLDDWPAHDTFQTVSRGRFASLSPIAYLAHLEILTHCNRSLESLVRVIPDVRCGATLQDKVTEDEVLSATGVGDLTHLVRGGVVIGDAGRASPRCD